MTSDGSLAAAVSRYCQNDYGECWLELWDVWTGKTIWSQKRGSEIRALAFSETNELLAVGRGLPMQILNTKTGSILQSIGAGGAISITFSRDNLVAYATRRRVQIYDCKTWDHLAEIIREGEAWDSLSQVLFSPDSHFLVVADTEGQVRSWSLTEKRYVQSFRGLTWPDWMSDRSIEVRFSDEGNTLIGQSSQTLIFWDFRTGEERKRMDLGIPIESYDLSPDSKSIIVHTRNPKGDYSRGGKIILLRQ